MKNIVSLQTAILAKEKEFNLPCYMLYETEEDTLCPATVLDDFEDEAQIKDISHNFNGEDYKNEGWISAPTHELLHQWLRDEHNITMLVIPHGNKFVVVQIGPLKNSNARNIGKALGECEFKLLGDSYEETLELGLITALQLL